MRGKAVRGIAKTIVGDSHVLEVSLRLPYIACGAFHVGFVKDRITRVGQDLVNASSRHDVAAQEQSDEAAWGPRNETQHDKFPS